MKGWTIAFIILCIFLGPVFILTVLLAIAAGIAPGTSGSMNPALLIFGIILLGAPFGAVGYMAFGRS